ncbi:hypothetical protein Pst134EA_022400, partial [Puccinia striiformis f. sp. tritici]|uniref:hypothetical protein n=1 Tax=Puccinia striiformis f. sp. tritici TaxID=168172 RepID=UPI00200854D7
RQKSSNEITIERFPWLCLGLDAYVTCALHSSYTSPKCSINRIVDQSQKRKITGCSSIEAPDNKRVACDKGNDVDDVNAVINDDQRLSISNKFPKSNSKSDNLIDRIFPPVTALRKERLD